VSEHLLVWERPEPPRRRTPSPLSREAIVRAAIALADTKGLDGVSLRKVGAALDAGPMRLYRYLSTKEELLDLMVDEVYGEIAPPEAGEDWRAVLTGLATRTRLTALRHQWFTDLVGGRPQLGPHALAHMEAWFAAVRPHVADIDTVLHAVATVRGYVNGAVRAEIAERRAAVDTGLDEAAWQRASGPYLRRMLATGRFPVLAEVVIDAEHPTPDVAFSTGLDIVLDGLAQRLA
jgi:AcrR family transcriptional regulator